MRLKVLLSMLIVPVVEGNSPVRSSRISPITSLLPTGFNPIAISLPSTAVALIFLSLITPAQAQSPVSQEEEAGDTSINSGYFFSQRCPWPRFELCNMNMSWGDVYLDVLLENQWELDKAHGNFSARDRELVLWSLAGGARGRWWWGNKLAGSLDFLKDQSLPQADTNYDIVGTNGANKTARFNDQVLTKRVDPDAVTLGDCINVESSNCNPETLEKTRHYVRSNSELERVMTTLLEERVKLEAQHRTYSPEDAGFCCSREHGEMCLGFTIDPSLLVCYNQDLSLVYIPRSIMLSTKTLDYVNITVTGSGNPPQKSKGNLRNFSIPPWQKLKDMSQKPIPTPDLASSATRQYTSDAFWAAFGCLLFSCLVFGLRDGFVLVTVTVGACVLDSIYWPKPAKNVF